MKLIDLLSLIFYNLNRRKGRVALTATGVIIGTAAVVILVSLANGLQRNFNSQLGGIGDLTMIQVMPKWEDMQVVSSGGMTVSSSSSASQPKQLTNSALDELAALPGVSAVIPRVYFNMSSYIEFNKLQNYPNLTGLKPEHIGLMGYKMEAGVMELEKGTALIGAPVLKNFFDPNMRPGQEAPGEQDVLNQQVKLILSKYTSDGQEVRKTIPIRIVGIIKESRAESDYSMIVRLDELNSWNEWAQGKRINRNKEGYSQVILKATDTNQVTELSKKINEIGFTAYTPQSFVEGINNFFTLMQVIFGGVGAVALLVAAIGIANTMTMAILERTREIGLMKAVGASNRNVLTIFLGEAAGIGFIGGIGGVALGWLAGQALNVVAVAYLASQAAQTGGAMPTAAVYTPAWLLPFALLFATLIGLLSGLYPALRAATLVPVIALKYE